MAFLGMIGCGAIGEAILKGTSLSHGSIVISDANPSRLIDLQKRYRIYATPNNRTVFAGCRHIVLAIKPDQLPKIKYQREPGKGGHMILSVMAGVNHQSLTDHFQTHRVYRCMPNMPIGLGCGSVVVYPSPIDQDARTIAHIFGLSQDLIATNDEHDLDLATIFSGCLPAFFAKLTQDFVRSGCRLGLNQVMAERLVAKSLEGTVEMLKQRDIELIIKEVTSKRGVTQAGMHVMDHYSGPMVDQVCRASYDRILEIQSQPTIPDSD